MWKKSKLKIGQSLKSLNVTKHKKNASVTKNVTQLRMWQNSKTLNAKQLKNPKFDKTQKLKMWQNSKTQNVTKLKNKKCHTTQKLNILQNSKTEILQT